MSTKCTYSCKSRNAEQYCTWDLISFDPNRRSVLRAKARGWNNSIDCLFIASSMVFFKTPTCKVSVT